VLDTPFSPELLPAGSDGKIAQKTEDFIGPYELHDFFLYRMLRYGDRPQRILLMAQQAFTSLYDPEVILKWLKVFYKRFFSQQFKRSCLPDGPKVGSVNSPPVATGACRAMLLSMSGSTNWRTFLTNKILNPKMGEVE